MQIKMTRPTRVDGQSAEVGQVVETDDKTGAYIIALGKAVPYTPAEKPQKAAKPSPGRQTRPAAVEHRDDD